jgi:transcriptional regulator with XRE-family HTH domain
MISDPAGAALVREVARRVRLHRLVQRLTQQDLADRADPSRSFISVFEKGEHGIDIVALARIVSALEVPLSDLVTEPSGRAPIQTSQDH